MMVRSTTNMILYPSEVATVQRLHPSANRIRVYLVSILFAGLAVGLPVAKLGAEEVKAVAQQTALDRYLVNDDASFKWEIRRTGMVGETKFAELRVTSQTWQETQWKHQLFVIVPPNVGDSKHAFMLITGGAWREELLKDAEGEKLPREAEMFAKIAEQLETPVAVMLQVPFQPMFDNKYEDALISLTFEKFVETGDEHWPLLLPMVKSAVKGMDATEQYLAQHHELEVDTFTVAGASKRGWTTWLTGAVDKRATAIAPIVIDVLNMAPQMKHQREVWGGYSDEIKDYTEKGLQELLETDKGTALRAIVDPYSYRDRLTQPKLVIIGTNDDYWPIDSLNLYWDDLKGEKYILYVPNNGHGISDYARLIGTTNALHHQASGAKKMPELNWEFTEAVSATETRTIRLAIESDEKPLKVQVWSATADKQDFRRSKWESRVVYAQDDKYVYEADVPEQGSLAFFGEVIFDRGSLPCFLSTNVRVYSASNVGDAK
jgi:PhoPQ-activated pathogenicity-related protein